MKNVLASWTFIFSVLGFSVSAIAEYEVIHKEHYDYARRDHGAPSDIRDRTSAFQTFHPFYVGEGATIFEVVWGGTKVSPEEAEGMMFQISFHQSYRSSDWRTVQATPIFQPVATFDVPVTVFSPEPTGPGGYTADASFYKAEIEGGIYLGKGMGSGGVAIGGYSISIALKEGLLNSNDPWEWAYWDTNVPSGVVLSGNLNSFGYDVSISNGLDVMLLGVRGSTDATDSDKDGVFDIYDLCPLTIPGSSSDHNGCADYQRDTDGDYLVDSIDKCIATPAGEETDNEGCSATERDSDGDGIWDAWDSCPNTPENKTVNDDGCSEYDY